MVTNNNKLTEILLKKNFSSILESIEYLWLAGYSIEDSFSKSKIVFTDILKINKLYHDDYNSFFFLYMLDGSFLRVDGDLIILTKNGIDVFKQNLKERVIYVDYGVWKSFNKSHENTKKIINDILFKYFNLSQYNIKIHLLLENIINEIVSYPLNNQLQIKREISSFNHNSIYHSYAGRMTIEPLEFLIPEVLGEKVMVWITNNGGYVDNIRYSNFILNGVTILDIKQEPEYSFDVFTNIKYTVRLIVNDIITNE